jgi:hypothetical protein
MATTTVAGRGNNEAEMQTMQVSKALAVCETIYNDARLPAADRLEGIGHLLGWGLAVSAPTILRTATEGDPAQASHKPRKPRASGSGNKAAAPTAAANVGERKPLTEFQQQIYALTPVNGTGIAQSAIVIDGQEPNIIGTALSRMRKEGYLASQGEKGNLVWGRTEVIPQLRAA